MLTQLWFTLSREPTQDEKNQFAAAALLLGYGNQEGWEMDQVEHPSGGVVRVETTWQCSYTKWED